MVNVTHDADYRRSGHQLLRIILILLKHLFDDINNLFMFAKDIEL